MEQVIKIIQEELLRESILKKTHSLAETNLHRVMTKYFELGFIIISADRSCEAEKGSECSKQEILRAQEINKENEKQLRRDIIQAGFSFIPTYGGFREKVGTDPETGEDLYEDSPSPEKSFIVPMQRVAAFKKSNKGINALMALGVKLSKKYNQDSFFLKPPEQKDKSAFFIDKNGKIEMRFTDFSVNDLEEIYFTRLRKGKGKPSMGRFSALPENQQFAVYVPHSPTTVAEARSRYGEIFLRAQKIKTQINENLLQEMDQEFIDKVYDKLSDKREEDPNRPFDNIFGEGKERIVYPYPTENQDQKDFKSLIKLIQSADPKNIKADFEAGLVYTTYKDKMGNQRTRKMKMGKYLQRVEDLKNSKKALLKFVLPEFTYTDRKTSYREESGIGYLVKFINDFLPLYQEKAEYYRKHPDELNAKEINHYLVISRHPIDVLRMSDAASALHSCHSPGATYFKCALKEAHSEGIVSFIVEAGDASDESVLSKDGEIFKDASRGVEGVVPIARLRVRRFYHSKLRKSFAFPEHRLYGERVPGYLEFLNKKLAELQNESLAELKNLASEDGDNELDIGEFILTGGSYSDTSSSTIISDFIRDTVSEDISTYGFPTQEGGGDDEEVWDFEAQLEELTNDVHYAENSLRNNLVNKVAITLSTDIDADAADLIDQVQILYFGTVEFSFPAQKINKQKFNQLKDNLEALKEKMAEYIEESLGEDSFTMAYSQDPEDFINQIELDQKGLHILFRIPGDEESGELNVNGLEAFADELLLIDKRYADIRKGLIRFLMSVGIYEGSFEKTKVEELDEFIVSLKNFQLKKISSLTALQTEPMLLPRELTKALSSDKAPSLEAKLVKVIFINLSHLMKSKDWSKSSKGQKELPLSSEREPVAYMRDLHDFGFQVIFKRVREYGAFRPSSREEGEDKIPQYGVILSTGYYTLKKIAADSPTKASLSNTLLASFFRTLRFLDSNFGIFEKAVQEAVKKAAPSLKLSLEEQIAREVLQELQKTLS